MAVSPDERWLTTRDAQHTSRLIVYDLRSGKRHLDCPARKEEPRTLLERAEKLAGMTLEGFSLRPKVTPR